MAKVSIEVDVRSYAVFEQLMTAALAVVAESGESHVVVRGTVSQGDPFDQVSYMIKKEALVGFDGHEPSHTFVHFNGSVIEICPN